MSLFHLTRSIPSRQLPASHSQTRPGLVPEGVKSSEQTAKQSPGEDQLDIHWEKLRTQGGSEQEGQHYLPKLQAVMEHAQKSQRFFPNLSHRHYGAAVVMNNGVETIGTNVESSRQAVQCDLRYATTQAFNQSVALQPKTMATVPEPLKVKTVFLVNANFKGDRPVPCSDCQEWMSGRFYSPDTKVVSLEQDPQTTDPLVRIRTVADMLPFHMGRMGPVQMTTQKSLHNLPVEISDSANTVLARKPLPLKEMRKMLAEARATYSHNTDSSVDSKLKTGVCVKVGPKGSLHTKGRFDWSTRWFEAADLRATAAAFDAVFEQAANASRVQNNRFIPTFAKRWLKPKTEHPTLQAVAYYGDDTSQPALPSLGRMARHRGSSETLILTVENDVIQCRTIADFMPEMYQTREK